MRICKLCKKEYDGMGKIFCSKICKNYTFGQIHKSTKPLKLCVVCGKKTKNPKFCSRQCYFYIEKVIRICKGCNNKYDNGNKIYCSNKCRFENMWNKGLNKENNESIARGTTTSSYSRRERYKNGLHAWNYRLTKKDPRVAKYVKNGTESRKKLFIEKGGWNWTDENRRLQAERMRLRTLGKLSKLKGRIIGPFTNEHIQKIKEARAEQKFSKVSSDEFVIRKLLDKVGISYTHQYWIEIKDEKRWIEADIFIPIWNLCIMCDGDYWHANPEKYPDDTIIFKKGNITAKQVRERYEHDTKKLESMNYHVLRLWGGEINKNSECCLEKILSYKI